jgi:hypothetical protein
MRPAGDRPIVQNPPELALWRRVDDMSVMIMPQMLPEARFRLTGARCIGRILLGG